MAIIRVEKTQNYTVMSNHHLRNMNMSLKAKGLMSLMLSLPPTWDYSIGGLVSICKESHTSIRSALKELEKNNYLVRERKNNEKGYFIYEYTLYEMPLPHTGKQYMDNAHTDNGHIENRRQLSKEELNTDILNKEEENTKDNIYIEAYAELLEEVGNNELRNLYFDYIEMRRNIESPISVRGLGMLMSRCERLANYDLELQKALVESAIINEWKNVYLPNEQDAQNNTTKAELQRRYSR